MFVSSIDEIRNRLDIIEVIGSYIKLQKAGVNFRALCPFHSEKKPSFFVSPSRQIWHCFGGCAEGGDIFKFVMKIEGVEFGDALRILAQKAGVELRPRTPESIKWQTERQRLYEICELATKFFEKQLEKSKAGKEAKKYLLGRGISEDSIKRWRLGYAPDVWQGLSDFLSSQNYSEKEVEKAGLGLASERGSFYDRFRGRIIFPIFDLNSQIVGFGGRVFKEKDKKEVAKYVNTPNTLLYDKSRILYGLDRAKVEIRKKDACILVEGYTDVIMAHQAGTQNIVATSGTALAPYQLKIIKRYSENLILGFDMDIAGDSATKRGIGLAQNFGFNLKVTRLPEGKDAADIIFKNPKEWEKSLENPKSILEFYFQSAFSGRDPETPEGKKEISKILLPVLKRIPNEIEKSYWVQRLAGELKVKEEKIEEELKKVKLEEEIYGLEPEEQINLPPKSRKELLEERLLIMILRSPQNLSLIKEKEKQFLTDLKNKAAENEEYFNYLSLKAEIEEFAETSYPLPERNGGREMSFVQRTTSRPAPQISVADEKEILAEIQLCLKELQSLEIKSRLDKVSQEIKRAESEKNSEKIKELTQEFSQLSKEIGL
ncbi:MAG TPA: DNA primase [Candidatus Humimicrobiaceae bacterium]|nr:DNA primase [Candidatus Humimicrobiaceae bacterium]